MSSAPRPEVTVVSPCYRAAGLLPELHQRLTTVLGELGVEYEIVLVCDGSPDETWEAIEALVTQDPRVRGIELSRNFGQHYALAAGLDHARGDHVVLMDCDLQDPPEEIPKLLAAAREGHDVVLGVREERDDSIAKRAGSWAFYSVFNYMTGVDFDRRISGFCLLKRPVVTALRELRESSRFLMAFVYWVGFRRVKVPVAHARRPGGQSGYSLRKLVMLALNTAIGFSPKPLQFAIVAGLSISVLSLCAGGYVASLWYRGMLHTPGWASVMVSIWLATGMIIANLGVVGLYLGKVYEQAKKRPLYIVRQAIGGPPRTASDAEAPAAAEVAPS